MKTFGRRRLGLMFLLCRATLRSTRTKRKQLLCLRQGEARLLKGTLMSAKHSRRGIWIQVKSKLGELNHNPNLLELTALTQLHVPTMKDITKLATPKYFWFASRSTHTRVSYFSVTQTRKMCCSANQECNVLQAQLEHQESDEKPDYKFHFQIHPIIGCI